MRLVAERIGTMVQYKLKGKKYGGPRRLIFAVPMLYVGMQQPPGVIHEPISGPNCNHFLLPRFGGTYIIRRGQNSPLLSKKWPRLVQFETIPDYLKSFYPDGSKIRQVFENPDDITWFVLTCHDNLFEIDRE